MAYDIEEQKETICNGTQRAEATFVDEGASEAERRKDEGVLRSRQSEGGNR